VWGGESPKGFDCSGLLQYIYAKQGVSIPRTSSSSGGPAAPSRSRSSVPGTPSSSRPDGSQDGPGHVGIYIGHGKFIEAPHTGATVRISNLAGYPGYVGARRYAQSEGEGRRMSDNGERLADDLRLALRAELAELELRLLDKLVTKAEHESLVARHDLLAAQVATIEVHGSPQAQEQAKIAVIEDSRGSQRRLAQPDGRRYRRPVGVRAVGRSVVFQHYF
jgi:hypothetical protein